MNIPNNVITLYIKAQLIHNQMYSECLLKSCSKLKKRDLPIDEESHVCIVLNHLAGRDSHT